MDEAEDAEPLGAITLWPWFLLAAVAAITAFVVAVLISIERAGLIPPG